MTRPGAALLLSVLVAVIAVAAGSRSPVAVRTEKCRRNKVLPIPDGKLKRVSKGAEEFLVKCDKGFKAAMGGSEEAVVKCSRDGVIENAEDAPKCVRRKKKTNKTKKKRKENKVKELLVSDWKRKEKMLRKDGTGIQGGLQIIGLGWTCLGFWCNQGQKTTRG